MKKAPQKRSLKEIIPHIVNVVAIALIVECFLCSMLLVRKFARDHCFERIEEATSQASAMFNHAMEERLDKLTVFADILAANTQNPDELLQAYMENFCSTQYFSALCIHRANGTSFSYKAHFHEGISSFDAEVAKLPYVSHVYSFGKAPEDNYIYQAVPIIRNGQTIAILYGYMSLDIMPGFVVSDAYDGNCQLYVVDGDTGDFLMDEYQGELGNIYDVSMGNRETKSGYEVDKMRKGVQSGESGFYIFRSQRTGQWYYTYYMPMGINNWSMQLTIDEPTAFAAYNSISYTMLILMICVILLIVMLIISLMTQNANAAKQDKQRLHRGSFVNAVQHSLLNAYTHSESVYHALRTVAEEMEAETVLLLSFSNKVITNAQYWPSKDKQQAMYLVGKNIREEFPMLFDQIVTGSSVVYDCNDVEHEISSTASAIFQSMDIRRMILVPIMDTAGGLKGALATVNTPANKDHEILKSVTYDFFMAITNLENHNIIKKMGSTDYLTGLKNRNCFEADSMEHATMPGENLWCAFIDANGLHALNNQKGHKAGDLMLCTVADAIKKIFGEEYAYRLGGDEFVVFKANSSHEAFMNYKYRLLESLAKKGYSVSIGFEGVEKNRSGVFDVDTILAKAEEFMYKDKWEYYQKNQISDQRDHFPQLEK